MADTTSVTSTSGFKEVGVTRYMYLTPSEFSTAAASINRVTTRQIFKYLPALGGVPVAAYDVRLDGKGNTISGRIRAEDAVAFFNVSFKYLVFAPKIGQLLTCVVNKVSPHHIGGVLNGVFNVSIEASDIGSKFVCSSEDPEDPNLCWYAPLDVDTKIKPGTRLVFGTKSMNVRGRTMFVEGTLDAVEGAGPLPGTVPLPKLSESATKGQDLISKLARGNSKGSTEERSGPSAVARKPRSEVVVVPAGTRKSSGVKSGLSRYDDDGAGGDNHVSFSDDEDGSGDEDALAESGADDAAVAEAEADEEVDVPGLDIDTDVDAAGGATEAATPPAQEDVEQALNSVEEDVAAAAEVKAVKKKMKKVRVKGSRKKRRSSGAAAGAPPASKRTP